MWIFGRERLRAQGQPVADLLPEAAVPPEAAEGLRTIPPRETGGNLDVRHLCAGSRLWLPPARVAQAVSMIIDTCDDGWGPT
jgi:formamidase